MSYEVIIDVSDVEHRSFDFKRMFEESIPCKERIVRCRDCKWFDGDMSCDKLTVCAGPDGYCAWAERRTDDN